MSPGRRIAAVAATIAGIVLVLTWRANVFAAKWTSAVNTGSARGFASPDAFGPAFSPHGDWTVVIDAPDGLERSLAARLPAELGKITVGRTEIRFLPGAPQEPGDNVLEITVTSRGYWTPVYAKYADKTEFRFGNKSPVAWPESKDAIGLLTIGELRVRGTITSDVSGAGLVGRPSVDDRRASVIVESLIKEITDAYRAMASDS